MCVDRKISVCVVVGLPLCIPATHQLYFQETIPYTRLTFLTFFQWLFTFAFVHVFVCAVPYRLHYCSISSWMSTSYSNPRKVKQIKKSKMSAFFFIFTHKHLFFWGDDIVWIVCAQQRFWWTWKMKISRVQ